MKESNPPNDQGRPVDFSAEDVIRQFGGIRPMAAKLDVPVTTVQGWKSRGRIPMNRRSAILEAARIHNVDLSVDAEREQPKKLVTITTAPVSIKIEDDGDEKDTVSGAPWTTKPPKADEPSGQPNQAWSEKSNSSPPKLLRGSKFIVFALICILALCGATYYFQSGLLGFRPVSGNAERIEDHRLPAAPEAPSLEKVVPAKKKPVKVPLVEPTVHPIEEPLAQSNSAIEKAERVNTNQPLPNDGKATERMRQVVAQTVKGTDEILGRKLTALTEKTLRLGETDKALANKMKGELAQLHTQIVSIREDLNELSGKLASLKTTPIVSGEKIALNALLLGQLESEVIGGRPYRTPLDRLRKSVSDAEVKTVLKDLEHYADKGVPTRIMLTNRFRILSRKLSQDLMGAEEAPGGFGGWFMAQLRSLVSVRRVSGLGPVPPLSKAERAVADGDFERAAIYLERTGSPAAAPWITDARAHLNVLKSIETLRSQVSALLSKLNAPK
ncbi:MAG: COG4223 family protein [Alphaproteobacteria bacterium]